MLCEYWVERRHGPPHEDAGHPTHSRPSSGNNEFVCVRLLIRVRQTELVLLRATRGPGTKRRTRFTRPDGRSAGHDLVADISSIPHRGLFPSSLHVARRRRGPFVFGLLFFFSTKTTGNGALCVRAGGTSDGNGLPGKRTWFPGTSALADADSLAAALAGRGRPPVFQANGPHASA